MRKTTRRRGPNVREVDWDKLEENADAQVQEAIAALRDVQGEAAGLKPEHREVLAATGLAVHESADFNRATTRRMRALYDQPPVDPIPPEPPPGDVPEYVAELRDLAARPDDDFAENHRGYWPGGGPYDGRNMVSTGDVYESIGVLGLHGDGGKASRAGWHSHILRGGDYLEDLVQRDCRADGAFYWALQRFYSPADLLVERCTGRYNRHNSPDGHWSYLSLAGSVTFRDCYAREQNGQFLQHRNDFWKGEPGTWQSPMRPGSVMHYERCASENTGRNPASRGSFAATWMQGDRRELVELHARDCWFWQKWDAPLSYSVEDYDRDRANRLLEGVGGARHVWTRAEVEALHRRWIENGVPNDILDGPSHLGQRSAKATLRGTGCLLIQASSKRMEFSEATLERVQCHALENDRYVMLNGCEVLRVADCVFDAEGGCEWIDLDRKDFPGFEGREDMGTAPGHVVEWGIDGKVEGNARVRWKGQDTGLRAEDRFVIRDGRLQPQ